MHDRVVAQATSYIQRHGAITSVRLLIALVFTTECSLAHTDSDGCQRSRYSHGQCHEDDELFEAVTTPDGCYVLLVEIVAVCEGERRQGWRDSE